MNNEYPKYYRHFKGGKYKALMEGKDSETQEAVVIYQALYSEHWIWVRSKKMFYENLSERITADQDSRKSRKKRH